MALSTLSPTLARLCNRFATEQIRRETYQLAGTIRSEYSERLRAGEAAADLETELERRILKVSAE